MKKLTVVLVVLAAFVLAMSAHAGVVKTDKLTPQLGLTFKGKLDLGKGYTFTAKEFVSVCNGIQPWSYAQLTKSNFTLSLGAVNNYRGKEAVSFTALKFNLPIDSHIAVTTEMYRINHDKDWFNWGLCDYSFKFRGRDAFVGVYYEIFTPNASYLQIGPHVGIGNYEVDLLLGKSSSAVRFCYTVPIEL